MKIDFRMQNVTFIDSFEIPKHLFHKRKWVFDSHRLDGIVDTIDTDQMILSFGFDFIQDFPKDYTHLLVFNAVMESQAIVVPHSSSHDAICLEIFKHNLLVRVEKALSWHGNNFKNLFNDHEALRAAREEVLQTLLIKEVHEK